MTSLAFMLLDVPEPVWKTSIGNSPSQLPAGDVAGRRLDRPGLVLVDDAELAR